MILNKKLSSLFKRGNSFLETKFPIMGGAMTWLSENNLVSAISNSGGFGVIACGSMDALKLEDEIKKTKKKTSFNFGVNLILMHPGIDNLIECCIKQKVFLIVLAGGFPKKSQIMKIKNGGIKVLCFATTISIAKKMIMYGIDGIILEGSEAGGHVGPVSINVLAQEILPEISEVPVFVAGGLGRGEMIVKFMELGASGCQIGTRFVCAHESQAHQNFKDIFIKSEARNTNVTFRLDERFPVIPVRAIQNKATNKFVAEQRKIILELNNNDISLKQAQLKIEHFWSGSLKNAVIDGDIENGSLMAGQSVSMVKSIQTVKEIIQELLEQANNHISKY